MPILTEYNPFDHLLTEDELSQYLTDAYEDDDPAVFVVALGHAIKHRGVAQVADAAGLNRESLYKVINGKVQPKWNTIHRLMRALGMRLSVAA
jgi:probable addiction module antidote protein